jgi:Bacterial Ig-like domain (group 2)
MDTHTLALVIGYVLCALIGLLGAAVLWLIYDGTIDLSRLISEANGDASMSRFQFLVFTFVIALSLFLVIAAGDGKKPAFPSEIPAGVLTLLGISGSSYAVGKAISFSDPAGVEERPVTVTIAPATVALKYGQKQQFTAEVARKPDSKVRWEIIAGPTGTDVARIDPDTGLFTAPTGPSIPPAPHATVKATLIDYPDVSDVSVVTFIDDRPTMLTISVPKPTMKYGEAQDLKAQSAPVADTNVKWEIQAASAGMNVGTIDSAGHYTAPPAGAQAVPSVTIKATLVNYADVSDVAVIKFTA